MAMRKYKRKPVEASEPVSADDAPAPASPVAAEIPTTAAPVDDLSALRDQLGHIRFAQKPIEEKIDEMPNLSVPQRAWLRINPNALTRPDILHAAHVAAVQTGIPVDSPDYFRLMETMLHQYGNMAFQSPPQQAPEPAVTTETETTREPPKMEDEPADTLDVSIYSAPVSRGGYATTGGPHIESPGRVTLSAAQREAARASGVSETEYAANVLKLGKMKRAGLIKD